MKRNITYSALVLLIAMVFTSCHKDLLDPTPRTSISDRTAFETRDRIVGQVNGIYASFKNGQYLGGRYLVYNDIRSDDFLNLQQNGVTGLLTWGHNLTPSTNEVQNLWDAVYAAIGRINLFLDGMEENKQNILSKNLLTEAEFNQFKGEALALRGLAYFHLSQLYARPYKQDANGLGMVLRLKFVKSGAENDMARSTISETYQQILSDLNEAENLLPAVSGDNDVAKVTRIHKGSVAAIKSRVYLHMENWDKVIEEANKLVSANAPFTAPSGVAYALADNFESIFRPPYTTSESIFSMPMSATELPGTQNGLAHYFSVSKTGMQIGNNEYPINQQSVLWTSTVFPADDFRKNFVEPHTIGGTGHIFLKKYMSFPHTDFVPVIRYAEVLLNLAEAEAMKAWPSNRAVALLNAVFKRSNPNAADLSAADFANRDAFMSRLMLERNLEFLGEGLRSMDVTRKLQPFAAKGTVPSVPVSSVAYVWPIPQNELNTNRLIQENP
ncbi:MAG: RagB/SusD family nutrient uptake outer membrane protein [Bacteroidetes bacterium]|nr:RagB/SusD family nutrient uptake outer membrane protein [Bacteroidota bacterium]